MTPSVLVVEDDPTLNGLLVKELRKAGYELASASSWREARERIATFAPNLVLLDVNLPDASGFGPLSEIAGTRPVVMLTAYGSVNQAVEAMRLGAADYLVKPVNLDELELVIRGALERSRLQAQRALARGDAGLAMLGESAAMQQLRHTIREVALSDVTVLIQGESGSGKELVAQALHGASRRRSEAFVAVDCCTLQESLFESELFGHERGAFTGADRRKAGLIEAAAHGTLFLDEIGEAGPAIQAKLLRVLETGRFRHVGATTDLRSDARIVAATNRDLRQRAQGGQFREDLYYRLSAFVIHVPPLRERRDDIALLAAHFIGGRRQAQGLAPAQLSADALQRLAAYHWPGNVRELRNIIERALILLGPGDTIGAAHIGQLDPGGAPGTAPAAPPAARSASDSLTLQGEPTLESIEREYLASLLKKYDGNRRKVAEVMGVSERTAYRMMDRHGYR
ncbi:sigma-54-dependent transcriptional regulator [Ottowia testudinis]|uniref:Sigma-54-dependent Fis family transcriptional regulator n=1 Tax=Ottowia testudinis TaxID=2816950 RepID=A0A975CEV8_9BURK|nr:sigma-54 dependent transcriptional regulator [Ottowia testudinis]QTD45110.1 sigma-54-dependent Fis family transcriptional regulator [Ottowia testudinis]